MLWIRKHWRVIAIGAAVLLYLFLAFNRLSRQDALPDEAYTLFAAEKTPFYLIIDRVMAGHVPLYFLLVHALLVLKAPASLPVLIAPSILFGLGGLLLFYHLALKLQLGGWSVLGAFLWAVHPTVLFHCRLARPSAGALLLECAMLLLVCGFYRQRPARVRVVLLLAVGCIGSLWIHLLAANWLVIILLLLVKRVRASFDPRLLPICVTCLLLHGLGLALCSWLSPLALSWIPKPTFQSGLEVLWQTWGAEGNYLNKFDWPWLLAAVLAITWLITLLRLLTRRTQNELWIIIHCTAVVPVFAMIVISLVQPMLHQRYLMHFVPPLILCLLHLLNTLQPNTTATCSAILVLGLASFDRKHYRLHETGMRGGIEKLEELTSGRNDLGVSYQITFPQMLTLFAKRPHSILQLEPSKSNETLRPKIRAHLDRGGVLWELTPQWFVTKLWNEMGETTGEARYQKSYPLFVIRIYSNQPLPIPPT
ncbi:MAG: hypothetical protein ACR2IE_19725 [Candidatus Sumerlaeaceae bacterium]